MLGAQALRTKQKVEQKEREKRHKERQRNMEAQRERIQKAASEDAQQQMLEYMAHQQRLQLEEEQRSKIQQRLSLHANSLTDHMVPFSAREPKIGNTPRRSPSTDCATTLKNVCRTNKRFRRQETNIVSVGSLKCSCNTDFVRKNSAIKCVNGECDVERNGYCASIYGLSVINLCWLARVPYKDCRVVGKGSNESTSICFCNTQDYCNLAARDKTLTEINHPLSVLGFISYSIHKFF
ncbi:unnamed protein product [Bursaphelenchus xylophilus]|uniref:(pine wood nematode) hypothetical protein n=1 Tax=Bursaphelenchus xylophilus TaxID=6326 RepID=A0A7I8WKG7_BURXY|nr:unnamed protein product [Bursaphelenchus xylophilus]CAG9106719.1 unnamed protein product [Bursaphelenchus xylophilus]